MRRHRTIRLRNRLRFAAGLVVGAAWLLVGALFAAWDAVNPRSNRR